MGEGTTPATTDQPGAGADLPVEADHGRLIRDNIDWAGDRAVAAAKRITRQAPWGPEPPYWLSLFSADEGVISVDDIRSEGVLALYQAARSWREEGEFRAYLQAAISRHVSDVLWNEYNYRHPRLAAGFRSPRNQTPERTVLCKLDEQIQSTQAAGDFRIYPEAWATAREWTGALWQALSELDPICWHAIRDRFFCPQCRYREVCRTTATTPGEMQDVETRQTPRKTELQALKQLAELMREQGFEYVRSGSGRQRMTPRLDDQCPIICRRRRGQPSLRNYEDL